MNSWWDTPSCSGFLEKISTEIWAGKITMVFLPKHTPEGFLSELKKRLEKGDSIQYHNICFNECNLSENRPIESFLKTSIGLNEKQETFIPMKASSIFLNVANDPFSVYVLQDIPHALLLDFKNFLSDLGRYFNSVNKQKRHKVLVLVDPVKFKHDDFVTEPGMEKLQFEGVIGELDQSLAIRYYYNFNHTEQKRFPESVIISLAQFDYRICDKLISCKNVNENYSEILQQFAVDNNWQNIKYKPEDQLSITEIWERWSLGIIDRVNGRFVYNSAFLKIHQRNIDLEKRSWLSGIKTLLPMIEEFRIKLLECNKIQFPYKFQNQKTGELKETKDAFEIGEIRFMIHDHQIILKHLSIIEKKRLIDFIELCRTIRNDLSHLKMPQAKDIHKFLSEFDSITSLLEN